MNFSGISRETFLGWTLRLPLRLIPDQAQMRILQGPLRGKKWIAGSGNHGYWLGSYEYWKQKAISGAIRPGDVVYDLGANVGFYSLLASVLVGPQGRVFSFEPVPRNVELLKRHLTLNGVGNCVVYGVAVSDSSGPAKFTLGPNFEVGHLTAEPRNSITVPTAALDELVDSGEIPTPSLIKCDIEGGEYNALKGAARTLAGSAPTIFLATHGPEVRQRCCGLLGDLNYRLRSLDKLPLDQTSEILAIPLERRSARDGSRDSR